MLYVLSSLFKKNKNYLGINKFKSLCQNYAKCKALSLPLVEISDQNLKELASIVKVFWFCWYFFFSKS